MPSLASEPNLFPDDLWSAERSLLGDPDRSWYCLHTKPRREKVMARLLRSKGIVHYLPLVNKVEHKPSGRRSESILPLFSSYLFLHGTREHRLEALKGNNLVGVLEIADQPKLVNDLRQIHVMLTSGLEVLPEPSHPVGTRVRLLTGPLMGLIGVVHKRGRDHQFLAAVEFLGQGARVALQDWEVEAVDESPTGITTSPTQVRRVLGISERPRSPRGS